MTKRKYKLGNCYLIRFYDHSVGFKERTVCKTLGWIFRDDAECLGLTSWLIETEDERVKEDNMETTFIIKSCIISSRKVPGV